LRNLPAAGIVAALRTAYLTDMAHWVKRNRAALWLLGLAGVCALPAVALAQGAVKAKHGRLGAALETPPGASREQCALNSKRCGRGQPKSTWSSSVLKTADGKSRLLRVVARSAVCSPPASG